MPGLAVRDRLLRRLQMALLQGQHFPRQLFGFVLAGETRNAQQLIGHARHGRDDDDRKRLLRPVIRVRHNMRHAPHTLPAANRRSPEFQNTQSSFHKHHLTIFYNNEWISPIGHPQEGMAPAAVPSGRPRPPARGGPTIYDGSPGFRATPLAWLYPPSPLRTRWFADRHRRRFEGLVKVVDQVIDGLKADGEADEIGRDAGFVLLVGRELRMGGAGRVDVQRSGVAYVGSSRPTSST